MGTAIRQTIKEAGYTYVKYIPGVGHVLKDNDRLDTASLELWVANKNHASYGIIYKNTHLEFVRSV